MRNKNKKKKKSKKTQKKIKILKDSFNNYSCIIPNETKISNNKEKEEPEPVNNTEKTEVDKLPMLSDML